MTKKMIKKWQKNGKKWPKMTDYYTKNRLEKGSLWPKSGQKSGQKSVKKMIKKVIKNGKKVMEKWHK